MFSQKTSVSARDFLSLMGQLNAAADFVMLGRLHLRPLQISLRNQWRPQNLPYSHQIRMTSEILQHLKWWLQEELYHQGIPLKIDPPSHTIFTDASLSGWGAHVEPEGLLFSVSWSMDGRPIQAPHQCARDESNFSLSITSSSQGKELHCTDIKGQHYSGGLYKASGRDSFHRTLRRGVERPEFVLNPQHTAVSEAHTGHVQHSSRPDVQSRQTVLHRVVPESGNSKQNFPDHGLTFNRPVRHTSEPQAAIICVTHTGSEGAINRCSIDGLESHTRLRVSTVPSYSSCVKIVLIAPLWPDRPWFPELLSLLVSPPLFLPVIPNLLAQLKGRILHQNPGHLQLHAWELSNNHFEIENFQAMLQSTSPKLEGYRLLKSMMQNGKSSVVWQINGRLILSRPLPR